MASWNGHREHIFVCQERFEMYAGMMLLEGTEVG